MRWLGIEGNHHSVSHEPDSNKESQQKLAKINRWFCEQLAYLVKRVAETPEPGGSGSFESDRLFHTLASRIASVHNRRWLDRALENESDGTTGPKDKVAS